MSQMGQQFCFSFFEVVCYVCYAQINPKPPEDSLHFTAAAKKTKMLHSPSVAD